MKRTYSHQELTALLAARGLDVTRYRYQFKSRRAQRMYLGLSAYGGKFGFNAAARPRRWSPPRTGTRAGTAALSCSSVLNARGRGERGAHAACRGEP